MKDKFQILSLKSPILLILLLAAGLAGCRPKGILHSGEMRDVLIDLHKTDALIQVSGLQYGHDEAENIYYAQVLEKHGITQAQFDSSIVWYTAHPLLFDKIYPKVKDRLRAERKAYQAKYADELNLGADKKDKASNADAPRVFTVNQLDSVLWVSQNGYPSTWNPWIRPYNLLR